MIFHVHTIPLQTSTCPQSGWPIPAASDDRDPVTGEQIYWVEIERSYVRDPKLSYRIKHIYIAHVHCVLFFCVCVSLFGLLS